ISLGLYSTEYLEPSLSIYYIRDNLVSQPYFARHGKKAEPKVASKYDGVVANSDFLADYLRKYNQISEMVGQGCDLSLFDRQKVKELPQDMKGIEGPIVGYVGYLTSLRLDIDIIENIAKNMDTGSVVLVGPEDADFENSNLHNIENVHFLGNKSSDMLPAYIASFDCAINPQVVNDMTIGNYPRKIDEYLAMGTPVVATYTPAMEYFEDFVYLSKSQNEFSELVMKSIEENSEAKSIARQKFAESHTWENNVNSIYEVMRKVEPIITSKN
ncbi:glycosyltransferase, partial [Fulvivirga sp. RKSG066]|uniref:glycosyltransferase n=1 Tax=Fulvivirga aurantia TaxID=2529383 RepID=UPI0012BCB8B5